MSAVAAASAASCAAELRNELLFAMSDPLPPARLADLKSSLVALGHAVAAADPAAYVMQPSSAARLTALRAISNWYREQSLALSFGAAKRAASPAPSAR
jgi:hypothetical protein